MVEHSSLCTIPRFKNTCAQLHTHTYVHYVHNICHTVLYVSVHIDTYTYIYIYIINLYIYIYYKSIYIYCTYIYTQYIYMHYDSSSLFSQLLKAPGRPTRRGLPQGPVLGPDQRRRGRLRPLSGSRVGSCWVSWGIHRHFIGTIIGYTWMWVKMEDLGDHRC